MFTRISEATYKPEYKNEFFDTFNNEVLPALRKVKGLRDISALESASQRHTVTTILTFEHRADGEAYANTIAPKLIEKVQAYLATPFQVKTYDVYYSSIYNIASGKAA